MTAIGAGILTTTVLAIFAARSHLRRLRAQAWDESVQSERAVGPQSGEMRNVADHYWILDGPAIEPGARDSHQYAVHWPVGLWNLMVFATWHLPRMGMRMAGYRLRHPSSNRLGRRITDQEVFNLVTTTSALLVATLSEDGDTLTFRVPPELRFRGHHNGGPGTVAAEGLVLVMDTRYQSIISAACSTGPITGTERVDRNDLLFAALTLLLSAWLHPTSHRLAERNAREIARKKIDVLEPASRFVLSLHSGLLQGENGPIARREHPLHAGVQIDPLIEAVSTCLTPHHDLDPRKMRYPYFAFLMKSNGVVRALVNKHELDVEPEPLFHNVVLHAIDHQGLYEALHALPPWSIDGSGTQRGYLRALVFTEMWVAPLHNPLESEYVRDQTGSFFRDLYQQLSELDQRRADQMVTSTSF